MEKCCDMKGFLSFLVLRLISKKPMSGEEIRVEIEKRRGQKPSPGTIYPVLKVLNENGWIQSKEHGKEKIYSLTNEGKKELKGATRRFISIFCDMGDEFHRLK